MGLPEIVAIMASPTIMIVYNEVRRLIDKKRK